MLAINLLKTGGFLLSAVSVLAVPVVVESLHETPAGWEESDSPSPDQFIDLSIGLEPEDHKSLERALYETSDPDHPKYGKHLSREAAKALLSPSHEARDSVKRWLSDAGVPDDHVRDEGEWLHIRTTVGNAEGMLSTRFSVFARDDESIVRTREYSVPLEIRRHITSIQPTTFFSSFHETRSDQGSLFNLVKRSSKGKDKPKPTNDGNHGGSGPVDLKKCETEVTPACIKELYKIPKKYPKAAKGALYAIANFKNMTAQQDELQEFFRRFAPDLEGVTFSDASAAGGQNPQNAPGFREEEGNQCTQYAVSLAHQVPVQHIAVGGSNLDFVPDLDMQKLPRRSVENWLGLTEYLLSLPAKKLPQVVSVSWGSYEQHMPKQYARQICNKFGQIGARGVSVIIPAGNQGVGISCQSNDGKNTSKFLPAFPSACPYVTTVGGTMGNNPERVYVDPSEEWISWGGGGFSELFERPSYQDKAVKDYLKKQGNEFKKYYNQKGRAYPDVSALAFGHQTMMYGEQVEGGGTSIAAPTFGAIVALLNSERMKKGKPAMGFLNPWLYKAGYKGFTDIVDGKTKGCPGMSMEGFPSPVIPNAGFEAVKGWDPVTGLGTPRYDKLQNLAV